MGNPIHIKVYDDKVIIYNSCQLPLNASAALLLAGVVSQPHNPLIANAFFRSGQVEAWGRGIDKMRSGCVADGLPEPEFDIRPTMFTIRFHIRNNNQPRSGNDRNDDFGVNFGANFGINETQQKIITLMLSNPHITAQAMADILNLTKRNVEYAIKALKAAGLVERVGAAKNGRWVVKAEN